MSYKLTKGCGNCKYFSPIDNEFVIGECSFHKDLVVNFLFTCFNQQPIETEHNFEVYGKNILEKHGIQDKMTGLVIGDASIFSYSDFLKSNKHKVHEIDSCSNCKFFDQNSASIFMGKCEKNPDIETDAIHICEKHVSGSNRFRLIHPTSKTEWKWTSN